MNESNTGGGVWTPICLTDKATGRKVHITIFERELYKSGVFSFDDLWEINNPKTEDKNSDTTDHVTD